MRLLGAFCWAIDISRLRLLLCYASEKYVEKKTEQERERASKCMFASNGINKLLLFKIFDWVNFG